MRQRLLSIETTGGRPPAEVDVAIVGGGAAGIATAYALSRRGVSVAVFEKGRVAAEQSSRNWGWCRTLGRDARELPMAQLSVDLWRTVQADTGVDVGFRQTGVVFVTDQPHEMETWQTWLASTANLGVDARLLSAEEANATHTWQGRPWIGGICAERDGYAEPSRAIPALAEYLVRERGVAIFQRCAVNELLLQGGKVAGVRTEHGEVRAAHVVLAGGAWSSLFLRNHGLPLPILRVHSSASASKTFALGGEAPVRAPHFSLRPREDGQVVLAKSGRGTMHVVPDMLRYGTKFLELYRARKANVGVSFGREFFAQAWMEFAYRGLGRSPFTRHRVLDPQPDMALVQSAYRDAGRAMPGVTPDCLDHAWGGVIDNTPDGVPVVSAVRRLPGLHLCTGFSGHGFSSSMGAGQSLAQSIVDGRAQLDLRPFSYDRLVDKGGLKPSILY